MSTPVGAVTAVDADVGATLSYALNGGNGSGAFAIHPVSGALTVADTTSLLTGVFLLTVRVSDGLASDTTLVTVTVSPTAALGTVIFRQGLRSNV